MSRPLIVVSVVSHRQGDLVRELLTDIDARCGANIRIVLTLNVSEVLPFNPEQCRFTIDVVRNQYPKGFGANHNSAFQLVSGDYFCVVNPDVRFDFDPFEKLMGCLRDTGAVLAGPLVTSPEGRTEDSARRFPTPFRIVRRLFRPEPALDANLSDRPLRPDWIGGMFMFCLSSAFQGCGGFDEKFFLYYEDVDLCARLRLSGHDIVMCPRAQIVHAARRESRRNLRYLKWHISSMLRFFFSVVFVRLAFRGLLRRARPWGRGQKTANSGSGVRHDG